MHELPHIISLNYQPQSDPFISLYFMVEEKAAREAKYLLMVIWLT